MLGCPTPKPGNLALSGPFHRRLPVITTGDYRRLPAITGDFRRLGDSAITITGDYRRLPAITGN
jgi:hypothetical protein